MNHYRPNLRPRDDSTEARERRRTRPAATRPPGGYTAAQATHYTQLRKFEARARMMDDAGLSAEVAAQADTSLDRARTATGPALLKALAWPGLELAVALLTQMPPHERAERSAEAVPWQFGNGEPRPVLHLGTLAAAGGTVGPRPRNGFDWLTKGTSPAALERAALVLTEDVAQVHDLLDAWDAAHGGTLPRPRGITWTAPHYDAALDAVGIHRGDRAGLTLSNLLHALRARLPAPNEADGPDAAPSYDELLQALPERWRPPLAPAGLHILDPAAVAKVLTKARALDYLDDDYLFKPRANTRNYPAVVVAILQRMCDRGALAHWGEREPLATWVRELFGVRSYDVTSAGRAGRTEAYGKAYLLLRANGAQRA